jgi:hypothetical protein
MSSKTSLWTIHRGRHFERGVATESITLIDYDVDQPRRSELCYLGHWQQSHRNGSDLFGGNLEKFALADILTAGYSAFHVRESGV